MKFLKSSYIKLASVAITISLLIAGCDRNDTPTQGRIFGYKPIYSKTGKIDDLIKSVPAKNLTAAGKIYTRGNLLLVVNPGDGIHIIDNTDPSKPVNQSYIEVPGSMDVAIKGNYLYADYLGDMVIIDISDVNNPIIKKQAKVLSTEFKYEPPVTANPNSGFWSSHVYFECVDDSKGTVIGWQYTELVNPKCYRN